MQSFYLLFIYNLFFYYRIIINHVVVLMSYLVVVERVVGPDRMVGLVPRGPVLAPVRTRAFAVQVHGAAAAVVVDQWRDGADGTVVRVLGRRRHHHFRGDRGLWRLQLDRAAAAAPDHHLVVDHVVRQQRLVVHEVQRRGGHRSRRGRVVDQRRLEAGGRRSGAQHEAHHGYGKVEREQDELPVEPERQTNVTIRFFFF